MAVSQSLDVSEVSGSVSTANNTSKLRIIWKSTQSGESWNGYTRTAKYYISINGGSEKAYSVSYTLPKNTTQTILDTTITVTHKDDGSGNVKVRTWMDTDISAGVVEKSQTVTLTTIGRASTITSASDMTMGSGNKCYVKWTPKSEDFAYKLKFALNEWSQTTDFIYPGTKSAYTYGYEVPLVGDELPNSTSGKMTVTLTTYSNGSKIGDSDSTTFTVTVPDNSLTKPDITASIAPVSSIGSAFSGLYIQGKTKVKATISGSGNYGASVSSYSMVVDGKTYGSGDNYTSGYLSNYGSIRVTCYVKDSRGYKSSESFDINVIAYAKPKVVAVSGESDVVAARCDSSGNLSDSGTYLKIKAKRQYSKVVSGGQKNFCQIRYRYKTKAASSYSSWVTILESSSESDEVITGALLGGNLAVNTSYMVQVQAIDDIGEYGYTTITIPTDKVFMHRDGARRSMAIGGYIEEDNTFSIAEDINFKVKSEKWVSLGLSENVSDSSTSAGRGSAGTGCFYRVVNGNHVYVAFNCAFTYSGSTVTINSSSIPSGLRPSRNVYSMCATGGRAVARCFATPGGNVVVDWIQIISSSEATSSSTVNWIDGYVDYFI